MVLSERLVELRKKKGVSQRAAAEGIGIQNAQLSGYERGANEPSAAMLARLAEYYGVTTDYLCGLSDNPQGTSDLTATSLTAAKSLMQRAQATLRSGFMTIRTFTLTSNSRIPRLTRIITSRITAT